MQRTVHGTQCTVLIVNRGEVKQTFISVAVVGDTNVRKEVRKALNTIHDYKGDFIIADKKEFTRIYFLEDELFFKYAHEVTADGEYLPSENDIDRMAEQATEKSAD